MEKAAKEQFDQTAHIYGTVGAIHVGERVESEGY